MKLLSALLAVLGTCPALLSQTGTKEYIYFGSRVIATEVSGRAPTGPAAPVAVSVTPSFSVNTRQTFHLTGSDANGYQDIFRLYFQVHTGIDFSPNTCHGFYDRASNGFFLYNDTYSALMGPVSAGSGTVVQNSQCILRGQVSNASMSGNVIELDVDLERKPSFTGIKSMNFIAQDNSFVASPWLSSSVWSGSSGPPSVLSGSPSTSTTATQTFRVKSSDPDGYQDIQRVYFQVFTSATIPANSCHGFYDRPSNSLILYNDNLTSTSAIPLGGGGTVTNSQCAIYANGSAASGNGVELTVDFTLEMKPAYWGSTKNLYIIAHDTSGSYNPWAQVASWTVSQPAPSAVPVGVSVMPGSSSNPVELFTLLGSDADGY